MSGFVSFVGSGPGDQELLTFRAAARLREADAVLFDDLSSGPILTHVRPTADLVAVGKRAGRPSPKQDHVSRLLLDFAKTGARVVRLKSGDPGVFGRLEEEIIALREAGVEYEGPPLKVYYHMDLLLMAKGGKCLNLLEMSFLQMKLLIRMAQIF